MDKAVRLFFILVTVSLIFGCSAPEKLREEAEPITAPVSNTTEEMFKVRKIENKEGDTKAIFSPADQKQLRIPL